MSASRAICDPTRVGDYHGIADIHLFEGGSHAFDHMDEALQIIHGLHRDLEVAKSEGG